MPKPILNTTHLTLRMPYDVLRGVMTRARKGKQTRSEVIVELLREALGLPTPEPVAKKDK